MECAPHLSRSVNWNDCEFIRDQPPEKRENEVPAELTGWETIVFVVADEEDDE